MLDSTTFESLPEGFRDFAKTALGLLAESGVILAQLRVNERILISGSTEQTPDDLAQQILEFRRVGQMLQTLQQLGEQYHKEMNHEPEPS